MPTRATKLPDQVRHRVQLDGEISTREGKVVKEVEVGVARTTAAMDKAISAGRTVAVEDMEGPQGTDNSPEATRPDTISKIRAAGMVSRASNLKVVGTVRHHRASNLRVVGTVRHRRATIHTDSSKADMTLSLVLRDETCRRRRFFS
jgi:hypothetical protein